MNPEDIDEDFEYAGECAVCDELVDMSDAGFCAQCGKVFCWGACGTWHDGNHCCEECINLAVAEH